MVPDMFKTVLFPIDQSRESREAAETVVNIVKTYSSRLIILSVVESQSAPGEEVPSTSGEKSATDVTSLTAQLLTTAQGMFSQQGIKAETIERQGKPAFTICDVADEIGAELIIMGCRGMGLTEEGVAESVTNRVINLSPCPVLIVP